MPATAIKDDVMQQVRKNVRFTLTLDSRTVFNHLDQNLSRNWHRIDISKIQGLDSRRNFKLFAANDANFSASLLTHVRMMTDLYRATCYKTNRSLYAEGQAVIDELIEKIDRVDRFDGFVQPNTLADQIGRMGRNILTSDNAAGSLFVALNDDFTVDDFKIFDCDAVHFESILSADIKRRGKPYIYTNGQKTWLDFANFLWQPLDPDAESMTGNNPLRPGLNTTFTKMEFFDSLRKVLKNQAWPKVKVILDEAAVIKSAPKEVKGDPKKLIEYCNTYLDMVEGQLTGIKPDQNIIVFDTIKEMGFLESSNRFDPTPIAKLLESELISSYKAPPSTIGQGGSTRTGEGLASAELVIFRRMIKALRLVVETIYSRAFTIALRLAGKQGYVKFRLKEFTLRPPEEAAQFDSIRQETVIGAWEVGAIGDDEKNRKIRQIQDLDGPAPADAKIRDTFKGADASGRQTGRTPDAEADKEANRENTRKDKKTGSNR